MVSATLKQLRNDNGKTLKLNNIMSSKKHMIITNLVLATTPSINKRHTYSHLKLNQLLLG